jgi:hypothetical protein
MSLTREDILALNDIDIKELTIPENIPGWGGKKVHIKQLTRGKQDEYLRRQFGTAKMRNEKKKSSEIASMSLFGHDAWLCVQGVCDENGSLIFKAGDESGLAAKNGEAIGWIAKQILEFSGMAEDKEILEGKKSEEEALADEVKN